MLSIGIALAQPGNEGTKPGDGTSTGETPSDPFDPKPDPGPTAVEDEATKYPEVAEAQKKYVARDVEGALELLKKAAAKNRELPPPKVMLASIHFRANNAAAGKAALDESIRDNPDSPEAFLLLAEMAIREARFTEAAMLVDKAVKNTGNYKGGEEKKKKLQERCYATLVPIAQRWKDWDQAKQYLDRWLELNPKNAVAKYRMGEVLFHQGKKKAAYESLQAAHKENDKLPDPNVIMARLFDADKDDAKARQWMNYAADQAGDKLPIKLGVARWHWQKGNIEDSKKQIEAILEADPHLPDAKYLRGIVSFYEHDYDEAKRQFESILLQNQNHLGANLHLALALLEQNTESSRRAAMELGERLRRAVPNHAGVVATAAWIYYRTGKHEAAEQLFKALQRQNLSLEAAYYFAKIQADRGNKEQALKLLEFVNKNPQPFIYSTDAEELAKRLEK